MKRSADPSQAAIALHQSCCDQGGQGYLDPESGLFCLSSHFLREQGRCCGQGCRHCPWDEEARTQAGRPQVPAWPYPE